MVSLICENDGIMNRINLEKRSFYNAKKLNEINITAASEIYFGSSCFEGSKKLKSVSLVSLDIGPKCFMKSKKLKTVLFFSQNVTFQECESLESVNFIKKIIDISYSKIYKSNDSVTNNSISIETVIMGEKSFNLCKNIMKNAGQKIQKHKHLQICEIINLESNKLVFL